MTRTIAVITVAALSLNVASGAAADEGDGPHGYVSLSYQHIKSDGFNASFGFLDSGVVITHSVYAELGLSITDRLSTRVGLPWITKRYSGGVFAHDPSLFDPPKDSEFIDDGDFHGDFQDIRASLHYRLTDGPFVVEPFVSIGVPTHDYPFFGEAAVGQQLFRFAIGSEFAYQPYFDDYYVSVSIARGFANPPFDVNVNHWLFGFEAGYFITPQFSVRGVVQAKQGDGLEFPRDFSVLVPPFDELLYQHDRLLKLNFVNVGGGMSYALDERNAVSFTAMRMVRSVSLQKMEYALTVGFTRSF